MNLTLQDHIDDELVELFYDLYAKAFGPMRTRAAARHMLTAEEFAEEMADKRIEKCVAWDAEGRPVALLTFTDDFTAVPWISPEYYAARYPEQTARGAVIYLGYTLVDRERATAGLFTELIRMIADRLNPIQGVCVFDVCAYNDSRSVGRMLDSLRNYGVADVDAIDVQTYYAASFHGTNNLGDHR